jgi:3-oxoacyl-(acyl-carrier-protein) synthase/3-hydroxymyristoyl/3-hydroxydecanoyl-(acyl carrier protein) dehydratase
VTGIAIVGMACLFPGASGVDRLWRNLLAGHDATSLATAEDLGIDPARLFDPVKGRPDRSYWLRGGYVREAPFDPSGLRLPADLLASLDELLRWPLHVAREALRDGGRTEDDLARCGIVLGSLSFPTRSSNHAFLPLYEAGIEAALRELLARPDLALPRSAAAAERARARSLLEWTPATLIASALGLGGASYCIDAACASSLYAVELAAEELRAGRADIMLAGAVSCADPFSLHQGFSIFQAYPEQGQASRPLDRSSGGLVSGEGAGMFLLKRYEDACRDGDRVHAVVRAVGLSNDGRGKHPLVPNPKGQLLAFERAYASADLDPAAVPYVECHATGTPLGDPIELASMERFFGGRGGRPLVGSVKSNFGHLLTAAGMAGMIKAVLALRHGVIPPTVDVVEPIASPEGLIGGEGVVRAATPWPAGAPRRAGVSAFGFGGTNAHLVLELPEDAGRALAAPLPGRAGPMAVAGAASLAGDHAALPRQRWKGLEALVAEAVAPAGAYLDRFGVDFLRYRVPSITPDRPIAQQLLLLTVADRAVQAAGLASGANVAVIVAMGTELELHQYRGRVEMGWRVREALAAAGVALTTDEVDALAEAAKDALLPAAGVNQYVSFIGNVMASRVSALFDFSGPAFTLTAGDTSSRRALELAELLLARGEVEAVVVGAVELGGSLEAVTARPDRTPVDGAAAVVLRRARRGEPTIAPSDAPGADGLLRLVERLGGGARPDDGPTPLVLGGRRIGEALVTPENIARYRKPGPSAPPRPAPPPPGPVRELAAAAAGMIASVAAGQAAAHRALLATRHSAADAMAAAVRGQVAVLTVAGASIAEPAAPGVPLARVPTAPPPRPLAPPVPPPPAPTAPIWDEADLLAFAGGDVAPVFGAEYAPIDAFSRRVRLPMPPYLLVSRVTHLKATCGLYQRSEITTEYDVPFDAWYAVDGQVPCAVAVESGQCDLLLISYLGIDFENRGERVYRLLDCTLTFLDALPRVGETLRYEITIDSFARSGENLLFFFRYDCFVGDRRVLEMRGGCAGFFSDAELERGKGVIYSDAELAARAAVEPRSFEPLLFCPRRSFGPDDLARLSDGDLRSVFGAAFDKHGWNPSLRLPPAMLRMFDRVVAVDPAGGAHGLGTLVAEKELRPDDWYFPCHFKDDEVLAGSLMAEGCVQLLQFYLLFLGLQTRTRRARFEPIPGLPQVVRCRGQVTPAHATLTYRLEVTDVGLDPSPFARADVEIVVDGKVVVHFKDLGLRLAESGDGPERPLPAVRKPALFDERKVDEFATGSIAACFGPDYALYERRATPRQPNDDLQLISRVVDVQGRRLDFAPGSTLDAEYDVPVEPWFLSDRRDVPYAVLMELGLQPCGFLSAHLGSTLLFPEEDFQFRNLDGTGRLLRHVDLRGRTVTNRVRLLRSTAIQGVILQSFAYQLSCDGEPFFLGDATFGHFTKPALRNQVGIDAGARVAPWLEGVGAAESLELALPRGQVRLDLLDRAVVVPAGGVHGRGYVYAEARVDPADWFYANHFYQDPVMPGSLGVEAMLGALRALAGQRGVDPARLRHRLAEPTVWKYRGQIVPTSGRMQLELHLKHADERLLIADASLWRDDLRIYTVADLSLTIE